jgi:Haem-degrading
MKVEAMTLDEALRITTRATGLAAARGVGLAVAVVNAGGHLIALHRMDGVPFIAAEIAWGQGLDRRRLGRDLRRAGGQGRRAACVRHRDHRGQRRPLHAAGRGNPHPAQRHTGRRRTRRRTGQRPGRSGILQQAVAEER